MDPILNPLILYAGLSLSAIGVAVALPRRGINPQILGGLLAGAGAGAVILTLAIVGANSDEGPANLFFYIFSLIGLGSALRVITHPRPVYAALYFILTILASAGLFLLLAAEFMTFALVIIYAGAILITYLFVIMLATQAPTEDAVEELSEYDSSSRDPIAATIVGFTILGAMVGMLAYGVPDLPPPQSGNTARLLERMPGKVQAFLEEMGVADDVMPAAFLTQQAIPRSATPEERAEARNAFEAWRRRHSGYSLQLAQNTERAGNIVLAVRDPAAFQQRVDAAMAIRRGEAVPANLASVKPLSQDAIALLITPIVAPPSSDDPDGVGAAAMWIPARVLPNNLETVGMTLVGEHPLSLELAGVILLMAMVGAVVLARKQTEIEEERKATQAARLRLSIKGGAA